MYKELTILCVEDETGVRRRIANTLEYYFGTVLEASDGVEGYMLYQEYLPDIIFCDIEMPRMDGIAFATKVRAEDTHTPIVMLTAYSSEEYLMRLINLKIQHYILKPVNAERLLEGIKKGLEGKYGGKIRLTRDITVDKENQSLHVNKESITLSRRETDFLALLGVNRGRIVNYTLIEEELWQDRVMSQDALKSFVRDLRKKIGMELFENVAQVGYRLNCDKT